MTEKPKSVATILDREVEPAIKEWLRRVNLLPELTCIPLNDDDRVAHLPKLFDDLTRRLRLAEDSHLPPFYRRCQARTSAATSGLLPGHAR